jgi:proteasome alpha subunit
MFGVTGAGYDMSTSIFSPEGRIFAAEYAKKAVEQGYTSIGILTNEGVILLTEKKVEPLQEPSSVEKISKIDEHIGVATSGLKGDARKLIQEARVKAQSYWLTFEEQLPAEALAEYISDIKAQFTQGGGARPYGVAMIIGSIDHDGSPRLFATDPVGAYWGFMAVVIGRGGNIAGEYLVKHYKRKMKLKKAIHLAIDTLRQATDTDLTSENIEIAQITVDTGKFHKLTYSEIDSFLTPEKSETEV